MTEQTPEQIRVWLDEVQQRCDAATAGPWWWNSYDQIMSGKGDAIEVIAYVMEVPNATVRHGDELWTAQGGGNAEFIAESRTDVPNLIAIARQAPELQEKVKELEAENERLRKRPQATRAEMPTEIDTEAYVDVD